MEKCNKIYKEAPLQNGPVLSANPAEARKKRHMLKNFFKVAIRNLWKHKGYSFLNIFGLAMGMTCSLLILLWIQDEQGVDAWHTKGDRLYRVYERQYYDGKVEAGYYTPGLLPAEMKKVLPEVELATGFTWEGDNTFQVGEKDPKGKWLFGGPRFFSNVRLSLIGGQSGDRLAWSD